MSLRSVPPVLLLAMLGAAGCASPGRLPAGLIGSFQVAPGDEVAVPIRASGGEAVALQLDLMVDPRQLELTGSETSAGAAAAGLEMTARPLPGGAVRVVVFGFDLAPLPAGELGTVRFNAVAEATAPVRGVHAAAADRAGRDLAAAVRGGEIVVTGGR